MSCTARLSGLHDIGLPLEIKTLIPRGYVPGRFHEWNAATSGQLARSRTLFIRNRNELNEPDSFNADNDDASSLRDNAPRCYRGSPREPAAFYNSLHEFPRSGEERNFEEGIEKSGGIFHPPRFPPRGSRFLFNRSVPPVVLSQMGSKDRKNSIKIGKFERINFLEIRKIFRKVSDENAQSSLFVEGI